MILPDLVQVLAVLLETGVAVTALLIGARYRKAYGWCIAATCALFVFFEISRIFFLPVPDTAHSLILLVACASMLYGVFLMYRELTMHGAG